MWRAVGFRLQKYRGGGIILYRLGVIVAVVSESNVVDSYDPVEGAVRRTDLLLVFGFVHLCFPFFGFV